MNAVIEMMLQHKSIRKFKQRAVEEKDLHHIIRAAQSASTSSFLQAYSVIQVTSLENRKKLRLLCGDQEYVEKAPVFLVFCADLHRIHSLLKKKGSASAEEKAWTESFIIGTVDASLAGQNAMLAAESLGLGGVYIGGIRNQPEEVSQLLGLPEEVYPVFGMCLGYPDHKPDVKERLPLSVVLHQDRYQPLNEQEIESYDERIRAYYVKRTRGKIEDSWTEMLDKKFQGELRKHMKSYLNERNFLKR